METGCCGGCCNCENKNEVPQKKEPVRPVRIRTRETLDPPKRRTTVVLPERSSNFQNDIKNIQTSKNMAFLRKLRNRTAKVVSRKIIKKAPNSRVAQNLVRATSMPVKPVARISVAPGPLPLNVPKTMLARKVAASQIPMMAVNSLAPVKQPSVTMEQMSAETAGNSVTANLDPSLLPTQEKAVQTAGIGGNKIMLGLLGSAVLGYFLLGGKSKNQPSTKGLSGVKKRKSTARPSTTTIRKTVTVSKKRSGRRMQVISL